MASVYEELTQVAPHIFKDSSDRYYWEDEAGFLSEPLNTRQEAEHLIRRHAMYLEGQLG